MSLTALKTDREEQWYNIGLYDGATANQWHDVSQGDLPKETKGDAEDMPFVVAFKDGSKTFAYYSWKEEEEKCEFYDDCDCPIDAVYWMEIPNV